MSLFYDVTNAKHTKKCCMQETISFAKYWAMTAGVVQPCTASMSIESTLADCPLAKLWHFSQPLNISLLSLSKVLSF